MEKKTELQKLLAILSEVNAKSILLLCHHNADPDALCAAYALLKLLERVIPRVEVTIGASSGISKLSKHIQTKIPITIEDSPSLSQADAVILLDTGTLQQLNGWKPLLEQSTKPLIMIDHHVLHPETKRATSLQIVDEQASSTCEVVYNLFQEAFLKPDAIEAMALFIGMAYDSKHFATATSRTFKIATELLDAGVQAEKALSLLEMPMDASERIARLKAAERLQLVRLGEWLLALSTVNSYQASAARALISLGAHVAIVGGKSGEKLRLNLRSSREFYQKTKIHLGRDIAEPLGLFSGGMGGGHKTAAGVSGLGDVALVLVECTRLFKKKLEGSSGSIVE